MIHFFDSQTLPVSRWRNGGGETREIISFPPDATAFSWRISIATIAANGAFSCYPGIDRIITLLEGGGVLLAFGSLHSQRLTLHQPFTFAGEEHVEARLIDGTSQDFNVMTRRESHRASVKTIGTASEPVSGQAGVAYVLSGSWRCGEQPLQQSQGVWWENEAPRFLPITPKATLLLTEIFSIA